MRLPVSANNNNTIKTSGSNDSTYKLTCVYIYIYIYTYINVYTCVCVYIYIYNTVKDVRFELHVRRFQ